MVKNNENTPEAFLSWLDDKIKKCGVLLDWNHDDDISDKYKRLVAEMNTLERVKQHFLTIQYPSQPVSSTLNPEQQAINKFLAKD